MMRTRIAGPARFAALFTTLLTLAAMHTAHAQLAYDHTTFVAGFGSGPEVWSMGYSDLSGLTPSSYLSRSIDLRTVGFANVSDSLRYTDLVGRVAAFVGSGGQHVLVAHSLGALDARGAYINNAGVRPNISAIIAVAAPHEGAPLSDNATQALAFFGDVQRRVNDGLNAAAVPLDVVGLFLPPGGTAVWVGFISFILSGNQVDLGNLLSLPKIPALPDLSPSSAAVQSLDTHMDDASIPRANIIGTIPFKNAAFRIKYSLNNDDEDFSGAVKKRNAAVVMFKFCKYIGYATIVLGSQGRKCAYAVKVLERVDERWALYVNGADSRGNPKYVPFDGVVPNERSVYPSPNGVAYAADVSGVDHQNIYKTQAGLDQVAIAMAVIEMVRAGGSGGGSTSLAASISGPNLVNTDWYSTWSAGVSGGTPPYTYSWSGLFSGSGSSISGTTSTGGDLVLDIFDAAGGHVSTTMTVNSTGCSGPTIC
jgi:hypothetical protein